VGLLRVISVSRSVPGGCGAGPSLSARLSLLVGLLLPAATREVPAHRSADRAGADAGPVCRPPEPSALGELWDCCAEGPCKLAAASGFGVTRVRRMGLNRPPLFTLIQGNCAAETRGAWVLELDWAISPCAGWACRWIGWFTLPAGAAHFLPMVQ